MTGPTRCPSCTRSSPARPKQLLIDGRWQHAPVSARPSPRSIPRPASTIADLAAGDATTSTWPWPARGARSTGPGAPSRRCSGRTCCCASRSLLEDNFESLRRLDAIDMGSPVGPRSANQHREAGRAVPLLRRLADQDLRRDHPQLLARVVLQLHRCANRSASSARSSRGTGRSSRASDEDRARARDGLHRGSQAVRGGASVGVAARRAHPGARPAPGRGQHRHWLRRDGRRRAHQPPRRRQDRLYRLTATGQEIVRASAGNLKRVSMELGGKSPDVIFADADLDAAVPIASMGVFGNAGQMCVACARVYVQRPVYDEFVERMSAFADGLVVGNSLDPDTQIGPIISATQLSKVTGYIGGARAAGAHGRVRWRPAADQPSGAGFFVAPTVLADVDRRHARSPARRSSARSLPSCRSTTSTMSSARNATELRARPAPSGRATWARPTGWPPASTPARCGSTAIGMFDPRCRSAATR